MNIKEWAKENGETPPYLKSAIDQIQDDKIERVVIKKGRSPGPTTQESIQYICVDCRGEQYNFSPDEPCKFCGGKILGGVPQAIIDMRFRP